MIGLHPDPTLGIQPGDWVNYWHEKGYRRYLCGWCGREGLFKPESITKHWQRHWAGSILQYAVV